MTEERRESMEAGTRDDQQGEGGVAFEVAVPVLGVRDLPEALRFYAEDLGFQVSWTWGDPPEMAAVLRGDVELHLSADPPDREPHPSRVYCFIRGVDDLATEYRERGVRILHEVADQPYGMRDFDLDDPSGNRICFGEPTVE